MRVIPKKANIVIVHCPGAMNNIAIRNNFYNTAKIKQITVHKDITVVSIMNEDCLKDSYLAKQCKENNINLFIPSSTRSIDKWKNTYKIDGILEALDIITTPYVLILDGRDVQIMKDIDETTIETFKSFNADIVFNGNDHVWPGEKLENEIGEGKPNDYFALKYINAGVCIGKRDALKQFYTECKHFIIENKVNDERFPSEQLVVRTVATKSTVKIDTDDRSKMFTSYFKYTHML